MDKFDISLFIAFVTATGYSAAFAYDGAYLAHYGVPVYLVSVSRDSVIFAVISIFSTLIMTLLLLNPIYIGVYPFIAKNEPLSRSLRAIFMMSVIVLMLVASLKGMPWLSRLFIYLVFLLLYSSFELVVPYLLYRGTKSYEEKLRQSQERDVGIHDLFDMMPKRYLYLFSLAAFFVSIGALLGSNTATREEWYLVFQKDGSNYALIKPNIAIGIDDAKVGVSGKYLILADHEDVSARLENIGRVSVAKR